MSDNPPPNAAHPDAARRDALIARLAAADLAYHRDDQPIMDDATYDALKREAEALGIALNQIGAAPSAAFAKIRHRQPMLSLDNVFDPADFAAFCTKIRRFLGLGAEPLQLVAEPKIDGLSILSLIHI